MAPETPRGVSSRLLTMKFMQRAATSASSAGSPESETHSAKKRKLGHSPSEGRISLSIDQATIKAALDDQEAKRQAALEQHVSADTHWVLKNSWTGSKAPGTIKAPLNVVYVGYGDIDSSNESGDNEDVPAIGRTSTRNFKSSKKEACESLDVQVTAVQTLTDSLQNLNTQKPADESDGSSDADSNASNEPTPGRKRKPSSDSPHSQSARSRSRSRSQPRQSLESAKAKEFREKRKKKEVKLSKLTSISSGGGSQFSSTNGKSMTCYKCHQAGHKAADCPSSGASSGRSKR
ncbi:hypothetical protein AK830_g5922 [Neonectria ditissima]|uniref:CCHC-type domain-containing protein n=1 Tax=Neonectria ditissima TaxID=78410 RepID=A0A0P7BDJ8_9HYPO|nr:hypothetical protein AK830_g5922 [Neonectria ditissima]